MCRTYWRLDIKAALNLEEKDPNQPHLHLVTLPRLKQIRQPPLRRHKALGGEPVCNGRWTERGKPHHLLQTSAWQRNRFSQQCKPLNQLPCHRGAIPCKVSPVLMNTNLQIKRALFFLFISSGCSDAFDVCYPAEHQLRGRDLFSVAWRTLLFN